MATAVPLTLFERNDELVRFTATTNQPTAGTVLDLTGKTIEVYLKPSPATADDATNVWKGSTATGQVVIDDAAAGKGYVQIPAADLTTAYSWYRIDVISAGLRNTLAYGLLTVTDL